VGGNKARCGRTVAGPGLGLTACLHSARLTTDAVHIRATKGGDPQEREDRIGRVAQHLPTDARCTGGKPYRLFGAPNAHAELHAGHPCRPPAARRPPRPTRPPRERCAAGVPPCSCFPLPRNGPRVSSSEELGGSRMKAARSWAFDLPGQQKDSAQNREGSCDDQI
jgi:hypothetical protein